MMIPLLQAYKLLGYTDGTLKAPLAMLTDKDGTPKPNLEYDTWLVHD